MRADRDVVLAKLATIDRCLRRIGDTTGGDPASLDDRDREDIFVLNLQRGVQAAIDLAHHFVATEGLGLPASLKESFDLLERHAQLPPELAKRMRAMVGFRNVAVHDYVALDKEVLAAILRHHLDDLRRFARYAVSRAGLDEA